MMEDIIREKGYLTLGTRLKRLGERLQADVQQLMDARGIPLQAAQYPLLASLLENGPLTVGELAEALCMAQPGITRSVNQLQKQGIVSVARGENDQRRKVVTLTDEGRALLLESKENLWPHIEDCLADICEGQTSPLLDQLGRLEDALKERPLFQRLPAAMEGEQA